MIFAIDFDGVIHDKDHPLKGRRMGEPIEGAKETIERLRGDGATIIVFSYWAHGRGAEAIRDWLGFYEIPFDDVTNVKPNADVFLDDRAVRFTSWAEFTSVPGLFSSPR